MRPSVLNPLFAPLSALSGIGPKLEKLFQRLIGREGEPPRIVDLLFSHADRLRGPAQPAETSAVTPIRSSPSPSLSIATGRRRRTGRVRPTTSKRATTQTR